MMHPMTSHFAHPVLSASSVSLSAHSSVPSSSLSFSHLSEPLHLMQSVYEQNHHQLHTQYRAESEQYTEEKRQTESFTLKQTQTQTETERENNMKTETEQTQNTGSQRKKPPSCLFCYAAKASCNG